MDQIGLKKGEGPQNVHRLWKEEFGGCGLILVGSFEDTRDYTHRKFFGTSNKLCYWCKLRTNQPWLSVSRESVKMEKQKKL